MGKIGQESILLSGKFLSLNAGEISKIHSFVGNRGFQTIFDRWAEVGVMYQHTKNQPDLEWI